MAHLGPRSRLVGHTPLRNLRLQGKNWIPEADRWVGRLVSVCA